MSSYQIKMKYLKKKHLLYFFVYQRQTVQRKSEIKLNIQLKILKKKN